MGHRALSSAVCSRSNLTKLLILGGPANAVPSPALLYMDLCESDHRKWCFVLSPSKELTRRGVVLLLAPPVWFCGFFLWVFFRSQASHVAYLGSSTESRFIQSQCQELGLSCAPKPEPRGFAFLTPPGRRDFLMLFPRCTTWVLRNQI